MSLGKSTKYMIFSVESRSFQMSLIFISFIGNEVRTIETIENGADLNVTDLVHGKTVMHLASENGKIMEFSENVSMKRS